MPATKSTPVVLETAPRHRRSVFGNYAPAEEGDPAEAHPNPEPGATRAHPSGAAPCGDLAFTRSFVYQFLARAFDYPELATWAWLTAHATREALAHALAALESPPAASLRSFAETLAPTLLPESFAALHDDYVLSIGHAARGSCPINEIEYGDLTADPLFQPHRLADLAAFYRAFGLELSPQCDERQDHLAIQLEFMSHLAAQEANLLSTCPAAEALAIVGEAQRRFLREHLGRWTPAFARRLHHAVGDRPLGWLARLLLTFLESESARLHLPLGSADLWLRPAGEAASLCDGCGLTAPFPGAPPIPAAE